mgnify:FL=1
MRHFDEQAFYNKRTFEATGWTYLQEYAVDFLDWYEECLKTAPKRSGKDWMIAHDSLSKRDFWRAMRRGIGNYFRAQGVFPDFREARDFTAMTLLNSIISPMPRVNPADKLLVGDYIPKGFRTKIRPPKVFAAYSDADDLDKAKLKPGNYVIKSNHGSTHVIRAKAPISKDLMAEYKGTAATWLAGDHGTYSSQWWYRFIDRKVFIEEDLCRSEGEIVPDFKFHCINGKVAVLQLDVGLGTERRDNPVFDGDLNYLPHDFLRANKGEVDLPKGTDIARDAARAISKPFPYVRVDTYVRDGKVFLGELTFLPNSGRRKIRSPALNEMLCSYFDPIPQVVAIGD